MSGKVSTRSRKLRKIFSICKLRRPSALLLRLPDLISLSCMAWKRVARIV